MLPTADAIALIVFSAIKLAVTVLAIWKTRADFTN